MAKAKYQKNSRGVFETKIWDGTYNADGSKHRKRLVSEKSSADLERQVNALRNQVENGSYVQYTNILFTEYANTWVETKKAGREYNTRAMYYRSIKHLDFLENIRLTDIKNSHFQQAINNFIDKPRTCQQIYITFRQIIAMAVSDGLIGSGTSSLICNNIELPKYIKKEKRPLNELEKEAIKVADFSDRERAYIYLIYCCGLRRGEALALSKFDFSFSKTANYVAINKTVIFKDNNPEIKLLPKSDNGFRKIPLPGYAASFLKNYIMELPGAQLFTLIDNTSLITKASYRKMWASIIKKMNVAADAPENFPLITDLTAHIFRHNYCTELCYQIPKISIKKIAYLMGDTEAVVLKVYNHIMDEKENPEEIIEDVFAM